jgi:sulfate adenylyltransferase
VVKLDLSGEVCPFTFVRTKLALEELPLGARLEIYVDHPPAADNVPRSLKSEGQEIVSVAPEARGWRIVTIKRVEHRLKRGTDLRDAIEPHGGRLIDRRADERHAAELRTRVAKLPQIELHIRELADLEMIASGALSPLEGFMGPDDYQSVVQSGRLANGLPWTLPVTLTADRNINIGAGAQVALKDPDGTLRAIVEVEHIWEPDREREAQSVYGTTDPKHPGVAQLYQLDQRYVGGRVWLFEARPPAFAAHHYEPRATRAWFRDNGWKRIAGFQTRNPIHRAHEYLTKVALELTDGLLIHPTIGHTRDDDIPAAVRMRCYEAVLDHYYPKDRVLLSTLPAAMRHAGPKEAVFHAIVRKNYGCTHFIVGRDHAGVGGYYGTYDAQREFDKYAAEEIAITPLRFESSFYCKKCAAMASGKSCPHSDADRVILSGSRVRELLEAGQELPPEFSRPEVARILIEAMKA